MPRKNPKYDPATGKATYPFSIPDSEFKRDVRPVAVTVPQEVEMSQNLAADYGMNFAIESLKGREK